MGRDETESGIALPRFPLIQLTKELLPVHKGLQSPDYTPKKCFAKIWLHFGWLYRGQWCHGPYGGDSEMVRTGKALFR